MQDVGRCLNAHCITSRVYRPKKINGMDGLIQITQLFQTHNSWPSIKKCISNNYYEENYDELISARKVVLEKFNLIKRIDNIIEEKLVQPNLNNLKIETSIYPKYHFEGKTKLSRLLFTLNKRLKKLSSYLEKFYSQQLNLSCRIQLWS